MTMYYDIGRLTEGAREIILPHVVECREKEDVFAELGLDGGDSSLLVRLAWNSSTVWRTLRWPAGLGDNNALATACISDTLCLVLDEVTSLLSGLATIEESMAVGSGVVGSLAKSRVGDRGNESVNGDHIARVASSLEDTTGSANSGSNLADRGLATVDELIADTDGIDTVPVTLGLLDEGVGLLLEQGKVEDTNEELSVTSSENVRHLVAVGTVETNQVVAGDLLEVTLDLLSGLAGVVPVVWRVSDSVAGAAVAATAAGWTRVCWCSWCRAARLWLWLLGRRLVGWWSWVVGGCCSWLLV